MSKKMEYLVILFSPPGPNNEDAEIEKIAAILKQEEGLIPNSGCKVKTIVKDVGDVKNLDFIQATMIHILRTDAANPLAYDVLTTGYFAKGYPFFQACYAVAKTSARDLDKAAHDLKKVQSAIDTVAARQMLIQRSQKRWWEFWK